MKPFSLTRRIIVTVLVGQLLLTVGLTVAAVIYARSELGSAFDSTLRGRATATLALVRYSDSNPPGLLFDASLLPPPSNLVHRDVFEIWDASGKVVARSSDSTELPSEETGQAGDFADFSLRGRPYRAVLLRNVAVLDDEESVKVPSRVTVIYAAPLGEMREQLTQLGFSVAGTSLLLLLLAGGISAWSLRRGLEPLHGLAESAGAISVHNWDFQPPAGAAMAVELAPLTRAIETVLKGLKESFRQQRDFTSNAAHELKTSVAIVKSTLQSLQQKPRSGEEYRAGLDDLLLDCGRLEDLLERMLRLARIEQWAENGAPRNQAPTELVSTCEAAIERIQRLADGRQIRVELVPEGGAAIRLRADPQDLELIWVNLLENAVQYSPEGSKVSLRVHLNGAGHVATGAAAGGQVGASGNGGRTVIVSAEDSGPGIPAEELPHVFERFHRGDPSRARETGGFGLGLAICKALVTAYGGRIEAINRPTRGTEVRVELPVEG
jgi:signal transduction histidine kinase